MSCKAEEEPFYSHQGQDTASVRFRGTNNLLRAEHRKPPPNAMDQAKEFFRDGLSNRSITWQS